MLMDEQSIILDKTKGKKIRIDFWQEAAKGTALGGRSRLGGSW